MIPAKGKSSVQWIKGVYYQSDFPSVKLRGVIFLSFNGPLFLDNSAPPAYIYFTGSKTYTKTKCRYFYSPEESDHELINLSVSWVPDSLCLLIWARPCSDPSYCGFQLHLFPYKIFWFLGGTVQGSTLMLLNSYHLCILYTGNLSFYFSSCSGSSSRIEFFIFLISAVLLLVHTASLPLPWYQIATSFLIAVSQKLSLNQLYHHHKPTSYIFCKHLHLYWTYIRQILFDNQSPRGIFKWFIKGIPLVLLIIMP